MIFTTQLNVASNRSVAYSLVIKPAAPLLASVIRRVFFCLGATIRFGKSDDETAF
jgi:hypothetical protein